MLIGSSLQPVIAILDADFNVVKEFGSKRRAGAGHVRAPIRKGGRLLRPCHGLSAQRTQRHISTASSRASFRWSRRVSRSACAKAGGAEIALRGFHVGAKMKVDGRPAADSEDSVDAAPGARVQPGSGGDRGGAGDRFAGRRDFDAGDDQRPDRGARRGEPLPFPGAQGRAARHRSQRAAPGQRISIPPSKCWMRRGTRSSARWSGRCGRRTSRCATTIPRAGEFASLHGTRYRPAIT